MQEDRWHYAHDGKSHGPVSLAQLWRLLEQGTITAQTLLWREGGAKWETFGQVDAAAKSVHSAGSTGHDPYRAPLAVPTAAAATASDSSQLEGETGLYAAFVGKNFATYRQRWRLDEGIPDAAMTWHWPGFLFGVAWIMYRKMYRIAAIWFAAVIVLIVLERLGMPVLLSWIASFGMSITAGCCGNGWYLSHCQRNIGQKARLSATHEPRLRRELAERGGTSVGAALAAIGVSLGIGLLSGLMAN